MDPETCILWYISIGGISALRRSLQNLPMIRESLALHPVVPLLLLGGLVLHTVLWLPIWLARGASLLLDR